MYVLFFNYVHIPRIHICTASQCVHREVVHAGDECGEETVIEEDSDDR